MSDERCGLCRENPVSTKRLHPYGVALCEMCFLGHVERSLPLRGITAKNEVAQVRVGSQPLYRHRLEARATGLDGWTLRFAPRTFVDKVTELFAKRPKAGDPIFDDQVVVHSALREPTDAFLTNDGAQTAVLEIVGRVGAFAVRDGVADCEFVSNTTEQNALLEMQRNVAIVLHHMQRVRGATPASTGE